MKIKILTVENSDALKMIDKFPIWLSKSAKSREIEIGETVAGIEIGEIVITPLKYGGLQIQAGIPDLRYTQELAILSNASDKFSVVRVRSDN